MQGLRVRHVPVHEEDVVEGCDVGIEYAGRWVNKERAQFQLGGEVGRCCGSMLVELSGLCEEVKF